MLEKVSYAVATFWSGMSVAHQQNMILGILALDFMTQKNVTTLNHIQRSCIMTVCPLLIVYVFICYRIFFSVTTFSDLKLTHNGMSVLIYLYIKIMFLVYLMNGWVFCFCMTRSETVLPLCVCVHARALRVGPNIVVEVVVVM